MDCHFDEEKLRFIINEFILELFKSEDSSEIKNFDEKDISRITKMCAHFIYDYQIKKFEFNGINGKRPRYNFLDKKSLEEIISMHKMGLIENIEKYYKIKKINSLINSKELKQIKNLQRKNLNTPVSSKNDEDDYDIEFFDNDINPEKIIMNAPVSPKKEEEDDDDKIKFLSFLGNNSDDDDETINFTISKEQTDSIEIPCPYCNTIKNIGYIKFSESPYYNTECSKCNKEFIVHLDFDPKTKIFVEK